MTPEQKELRRRRDRTYRLTHREGCAARTATYRLTHRDQLVAKSAAWRLVNPGKGVAYRVIHRKEMTEYQKQYRRIRRKEFEALKAKPCADCGGTFPPECMDFDHINGNKIATIAQLAIKSRSRMLAEIAKCELVCSNCHRIRSYKRKKTRQL